MTLMKIHFGKLLQETLREQGRSVTWFARQLCCTRPNVYKIFQKESVDSSLMLRIPKILQHDFFQDFSQAYRQDND